MSTGVDPRNATQAIEQERRRLSQRLEEMAKLCDTDQPPPFFYSELLQRLVEALAAAAGAVWLRTAQGQVSCIAQTNFEVVGLQGNTDAQQNHFNLLQLAFSTTQPIPALRPQQRYGTAPEGAAPPGNPTAYLLLLVPIVVNGEVLGILEIFQNPQRPANAVPGYLQYMNMMADLGVRYHRNQQNRLLLGQQKLWTQLEVFARQIHGSLNPVEVAYQAANEGRRLIDCDRVSVAVRKSGNRPHIEAVSNTDVVEKRSNQIYWMRKLCEHVMDWGEKLVFTGTRDDSLPPKVLEALDGFLAESPSKLLVVQPLLDQRKLEDKEKDKDKPKPPIRAALVMECYESPADQEAVLGKMEVISKHISPALYNAIEYRRIPFRFVWLPLARLREGLGGTTKAITLLVIAALSLLGAMLWAFPYPLKLDASGQLLPQVRRVVYTPAPGVIESFDVQPGQVVKERTVLARMFDNDLKSKMIQLQAEMRSADIEVNEAETQAKNATTQQDKISLQAKAALKKIERDAKAREIVALINRANALRGDPGRFLLLSPTFTAEERRLLPVARWTVLNGNFREEWTGRLARPSEPILRVGAREGPWEIELKIPQKHIGQVMRAYSRLGQEKALDVDFVLRTDPNRKFKGKLYYDRISGEAYTQKEEATSEAEPVVLAYVSIDDSSIDKDYRLSSDLLKLSGTEVTAKIRCGSYRSGYSLFYGVWEFLYEKVVFFF